MMTSNVHNGHSQDRPYSQSEESSFSGAPPSVSLPRGGGAIRGIGEKFTANPGTGTGAMSVPIATSPGRAGFGPQLSLSYDSGSGNGPFGLGWGLSIPAITRKTSKGLPRYLDVKSEVERTENTDTFMLSGAEDLVPALKERESGSWQLEAVTPQTVGGITHSVQQYRPRIEGLFARIEKWTNQTHSEDTFWRSISSDNITTWYGKDANSRIADPANPARIFSWLICESYDDKGNVISYRYKAEDASQVSLSQVHERNRTDESRSANRYLKQIWYGNRDPYFPMLEETQPWPSLPDDSRWLFEAIFDYGEYDQSFPNADSHLGTWPSRPDPSSSYRAGFEVRTYRRCERVLMFHHFPNTPDGANEYDGLVSATEFTYTKEANSDDAQNSIYSRLMSVTQTGYQKNLGNNYSSKSLPPLEFVYSEPSIDETVRDIDPKSLENLPEGLEGDRYRWVALYGEGLSGILSEQGGGWFYKRNVSPINTVNKGGSVRVAATFLGLERVATKPAMALAGGAGFLDLAGDGQPDVVNFQGEMAGFYERSQDETWNHAWIRNGNWRCNWGGSWWNLRIFGRFKHCEKFN